MASEDGKLAELMLPERTDTGQSTDVVYVPILKWKEGEQLALRDLRGIPLDAMRPVIELVPTPPPSEPKVQKGLTEPRPARSMDLLAGHAIGKAMDAIGRTPYKTRPFYLDAAALANEKVVGGDAVAEVYDQVVRRGFSTIPVIRVPLDGGPITPLPFQGQTVCYRLDASRGGPLDLESIRRSAAGRRMHLILDFRSVMGAYVRPKAERMVQYATAAFDVFDAVVIAASAFPDGLHDVGQDNAGNIDRVDLLAWLRYRRMALEQHSPVASYGDYGIQHPRLFTGRGNAKQTAGIRYTLDREWLVLRGHAITKENGARQFVTLAKNLVGRTQFMGAHHCIGCRAVQDTADEAGRDMIVGLGGWRHYGTVHHLTTTLRQILAARA